MKSILIFAAMALGFASHGAAAEPPIKLSLATLSEPGDAPRQFFEEWTRKVEADSNNAVAIELRDGFVLANFGNIVERVQSGVVQIGWTIQANYGGKYRLTQVAGLPFVAPDPVAASVALWRLYKTGILDREYPGIVPLWLAVGGAHLGIHLVKAPKSYEALSGLKIRVFSEQTAQMAELLGMAPQSIPITETYQALERRTVDGLITTYEAFPTMKLDEVTHYHLDLPLGASTEMIFMSKPEFDGLPVPVRKALVANSGEGATRSWTMLNAERVKETRARLLAEPTKQTIVELPPAKYDEWKDKIAKPIIADWEKSVPDGTRALAMFEKLYAEAAAGK